MEKILWAVALCLALVPVRAQQAPDARKILDGAAALFTDKGGIKATFKADHFSEGNLRGSTSGTMCIQGNKFRTDTPDMITWYNGETQWNYVKANDEVNVSVPTLEERQGMNPNTFVNLYKEGYGYQLKETALRGKSCYEITLTARDRRKSPRTIILDIGKDDRILMCVRMRQREKGEWTRISIRRLRTGQSFAAADFEFDPKDYPRAEIIDLR